MRRLVSRLRSVREIDRRLHLLNRHLPHRGLTMCSRWPTTFCARAHGPEDVDGLHNNVPYLDALDAEMIPIPTTARDVMRRFEQEYVVALMEEELLHRRAHRWKPGPEKPTPVSSTRTSCPLSALRPWTPNSAGCACMNCGTPRKSCRHGKREPALGGQATRAPVPSHDGGQRPPIRCAPVAAEMNQ